MFFAVAARLGNRSPQRAGYSADSITRTENGLAGAKASNGATANCPVPFLQHRPIFFGSAPQMAGFDATFTGYRINTRAPSSPTGVLHQPQGEPL